MRNINIYIRMAIARYLSRHGTPQDTREIIATFAKRYATTKQRVSGNLAAMKKAGSIRIDTVVEGKKSLMY